MQKRGHRSRARSSFLDTEFTKPNLLMGTSNNCHRSSGAPNLPANDSALFSFRFCAVHPKDVRSGSIATDVLHARADHCPLCSESDRQPSKRDLSLYAICVIRCDAKKWALSRLRQATLTEEAAVLIFLNDCEKIVDGCNFGIGLVAVPL